MPSTTVDREQRTFTRELARIEIREADEGSDDIGTLSGYAAVFDSPSVDMYGMVEFVGATAFDRSLSDKDDVRALAFHSSHHVIGRASAGTLRLSTDKVGLRFEVDLPDTQVGRDLLTSIRRGDLDGMSFGFRVRADEWNYSEDEPDRRTLLDVELLEISVVAWPAYPDTSVGVRSVEDVARQGREIKAERRKLSAEEEALIDQFRKKPKSEGRGSDTLAIARRRTCRSR